MVLLLIDDVLDDALLFGLAVGERAVTALPRLEHGEHVAVGPHEIARGNLQVVDEGRHGDCRVQSDAHVYVVGHAIDAVEHALVVLAEAEDVHVQVALVRLVDDGAVVLRAEYDVVYQFRECHIICGVGLLEMFRGR